MLSVFIGVILLVGSVYDWKYHSLPTWLLTGGVAGGLLGMGYDLLWGSKSVAEVALVLLPGAVMLLLAYATREQIGYGDGVMLLAMGGCMGIQQTLWTLFAALTGTFGISVWLLTTRKARGNRRLPFVPFLFIGSVVVMLCGLL